MKVRAVENDHAMLDLVSHFLGIATHHNINAAPSATVASKANVENLVPSSEFEQRARLLRQLRQIRRQPDGTGPV